MSETPFQTEITIDPESATEYAKLQRQICDFLRSNNITSASQIRPEFIKDVFAHVVGCAESEPHKPITGLPDLDEF